MAVLTGCAASGAAGRDPLQAPDRFTVYYREDAVETGRELTIDADRAWEVLPDVFRELGFPSAPASRTDERVMMTPHLMVRGEMYPGERTSDYLNCGSTRSAGTIADNYDVTFVIIATLTEVDEARTRVDTRVDGHATAPAGRAGSVRCNSTGKFEEQISELLLRRARGR